MKGFCLIVVVTLAALASASRPNEQQGRFDLYKVKPKNAEEVGTLLRSNEDYGSHPPIFLQPVQVGQSVLVLVEQSKVSVFDRVLNSSKIKSTKKGLTLIDNIKTTLPPVFVGESFSLALPPLDSNCQWTGCEGKTRFGVDICNEYGTGRYTGNTNYEDCAWDTSRVECCQPLPPGTVKWSKKCYGIAYGGDYVCSTEYGPGFRSRNKMACNSFTYAYECYN